MTAVRRASPRRGPGLGARAAAAFAPAFAALAVLASAGAAGPAPAQPVPQCVARGVDAQGGTGVQNLCDGPISIAWCDASGGPPGIDVPPCGDGTPLNPCYTASMVLAPGRSATLYPQVKLVACNGSGSATGTGGFRSDASGRATCPPRAPLARDAWPDTIQASSVESAARACALAREAFAPADLAPGDCECEAHPVGTRSVHACAARGRLPGRDPAEQAYGDHKAWARELSGGDPQSDPSRCERRRRSVPTGVRGRTRPCGPTLPGARPSPRGTALTSARPPPRGPRRAARPRAASGPSRASRS